MAGDAAGMQMLAELEVEMMTDMYNRYVLQEILSNFNVFWGNMKILEILKTKVYSYSRVL